MSKDDKVKKLEQYIDLETLILHKDWELAINPDKSRVAFLPVRPDWNEPRKMWGYYNPLTGLFYPTDALKVLLNAFRDYVVNKNQDNKHFIILDEMNLARVEYYMSDLLSLMENMWQKDKDQNIQKGETTQIHPYIDKCVLSQPNGKKDESLGAYVCASECNKCPYYPLLKPEQNLTDWKPESTALSGAPIPPRIAYPRNLNIIGTVNVDETTFSFSPKVLDRAFVVEFNDVNVDVYCKEYGIPEGQFKKFVSDLHQILKPATLHFGYRVISEMWEYLGKPNEGDIPNESFDFLLKSKVLPKIHGTEEQVGQVLKKLFLYSKTGSIPETDEKIEEALKNSESDNKVLWYSEEPEDSLFQESAKKIQDMYKRMKAVGYASFF